LRSAGSAATEAEQTAPTPHATPAGVSPARFTPRHGCVAAGFWPWFDLGGPTRRGGWRRRLGSLRVALQLSSWSPANTRTRPSSCSQICTRSPGCTAVAPSPAVARGNCKNAFFQRTVQSFCTSRSSCTDNTRPRSNSSGIARCTFSAAAGATPNCALKGAKNSSSKNRFAVSRSLMPRRRSAFTNRSCSVPCIRSTRPLACGLRARISFTPSSSIARPNCVCGSFPARISSSVGSRSLR